MTPVARSRAMRGLAAAAVLAVLGCCIDALFIEPDRIEVVRSVENLPMHSPGAADLVLVHLSDIHVGAIGRRERRAIEIIDQVDPDLIVLTGDLVHGSDHPSDLEVFLGSLHARCGKYVVWGNHDHWARLPYTWGPEVVRRSGFTLLSNESAEVTCRGASLVVAGVDDPVSGHDNLRLALAQVRRNDTCILLAHSPEIAPALFDRDVDLVLAGHTHGGQARLPYIGALLVPPGTRDYVQGWFDLSARTRLHVNRGLGWSYLPIRFLCPPTIDVITLHAG